MMNSRFETLNASLHAQVQDVGGATTGFEGSCKIQQESNHTPPSDGNGTRGSISKIAPQNDFIGNSNGQSPNVENHDTSTQDKIGGEAARSTLHHHQHHHQQAIKVELLDIQEEAPRRALDASSFSLKNDPTTLQPPSEPTADSSLVDSTKDLVTSKLDKSSAPEANDTNGTTESTQTEPQDDGQDVPQKQLPQVECATVNTDRQDVGDDKSTSSEDDAEGSRKISLHITIAGCEEDTQRFVASVPAPFFESNAGKSPAIGSYGIPSSNGNERSGAIRIRRSGEFKSLSHSSRSIGFEVNSVHIISSSDGVQHQQSSSSKDISSSNGEEVWMPLDGSTFEQSKSRPSYLKNDELKILHEYVKSRATKLHDGLDEDAIGIRMVRTDQVVKERARCTADPEADSEEEEERISQAASYQKEMEFLLKQDFFKQVAKDTNAANFHKRTMYWLKKEMGLSRRSEVRDLLGRRASLEAKAGSGDETDDEGNRKGRRRLTRTMARNTRIKKREDRQSTGQGGGLYVLAIAANETLLDLEPPKSRKRGQVSIINGVIDRPEPKKPKNTRHTNVKTGSPLDLSGFIRVSKWLKSAGQRAAMNLDRKLEIKITSIVVDGTNIEPELREELKDDEDSKAVRNAIPRRSKQPRIDELASDEEEFIAIESPTTHGLLAPASKRRYKRKKRKVMAGEPPATLTTENTRISVGLLDWKRRHQYMPAYDDCQPSSIVQLDEEDVDPDFRVTCNLDNTGVDVSLPQWEETNLLSTMAREPLPVDPRRNFQNDRRYASWCAKLINCLNGRGRSFARNEFFYSDIDRPWFNFDSFRVELAKMGISPDTKFSRSEWSVIRQQIRKRPRRFSKNFVAEESNKLRKYRHVIWEMQHEGRARPEGFLFDVPDSIVPGTTVTALHQGLDILHRGVVLGYDKNRASYLVQFERKELGFWLCPDHEVASHGEPKLLSRMPSAHGLDGTEIGGFGEERCPPGATGYGTGYAQVKFPPKDSVFGNIKSHQAQRKEKELEDIEKLAEREILVKLTETIEMSMKRKSLLLDTIEEFNSIAANVGRKMDDEPMSQEFADHYAWLLGNLDMTSKSLEAALAHLQVMYGNAYNGNDATEVARDASGQKEMDTIMQLERTIVQDHSRVGLFSTWAAALVSNVRHHGAVTNDTSLSSFGDRQRHKFLESRLCHSQELITCAEYSGRYKEPTGNVGLSKAVAVIFETNVKNFESPEHDFPGQLNGMREGALRELKEAVAGYHSELDSLYSRGAPTQKQGRG